MLDLLSTNHPDHEMFLLVDIMDNLPRIDHNTNWHIIILILNTANGYFITIRKLTLPTLLLY